MRVPLMILLGFFDVEEPNTAPGPVLKKLSLAKFLKVIVQTIDLVGEWSVGVSDG